MKRLAAILAAFAAVCASAAPPAGEAPFRLPPSARLCRGAGGWQGVGEIQLPPAAAEQRFGSALYSSGWRHVHTIHIAQGESLETWRRGGEELTLMLRKVSPDCTEFSFGVSKAKPEGGVR